MEPKYQIFIAIFLIIVVLLGSLPFLYFFTTWIRAYMSGCRVTVLNLIGMRLRKVSPLLIVEALIRVKKGGLDDISTDELEAHYLAQGNVLAVVDALIAASRADLDLSFKQATAIDLAGRNVLDAVQTSVNPRVIDCPDPTKGRSTIDAVAKDGIQLRCKARVTVRANLKRLIGGATEETIIARVGEGIVTSVGSEESHKNVLENPDLISSRVLAKGLDANTAFEIISIDIADVDIGENIGARLQIEQAEADKRVAQAKAEERRAAAVALEQEMIAEVQKMRAKVVEAQAQVPLAMSDAFRDGSLGVLDYYRIENLKADTSMRSSLGDIEEDDIS
ncbi:MAG: flotillin-like protein FloA [Lentisphaeria bacterium]|nr:flotillin-like protein FloA [Lentisphaeria bacterium]